MKHVLNALLAVISTIALMTIGETSAVALPQQKAPQAVQPAAADINLDNPKPAAHATGRLWNLQDADILSIINEVSLETGKNFIVDPRVSGKISLISSKPIKANEVYQVFLSVLELLGYSASAIIARRPSHVAAMEQHQHLHARQCADPDWPCRQSATHHECYSKY
jgi:hypothetical protein